MLGLGFFLAQFTTQEAPWVLWLTYGVMGGFGMGMVYTTTIACCQKWFPDKRGLVTGIIVSALGFGGLVFPPVAEALSKANGVLKTFAVFGVIFLIVTLAGSSFCSNPQSGKWKDSQAAFSTPYWIRKTGFPHGGPVFLFNGNRRKIKKTNGLRGASSCLHHPTTRFKSSIFPAPAAPPA